MKIIKIYLKTEQLSYSSVTFVSWEIILKSKAQEFTI